MFNDQNTSSKFPLKGRPFKAAFTHDGQQIAFFQDLLWIWTRLYSSFSNKREEIYPVTSLSTNFEYPHVELIPCHPKDMLRCNGARICALRVF